VDRNLLIISHSYSTFVKNSADKVSPYFKEINVLVRVNPIAELSGILPIDYLRPYSSGVKIDMANKPSNLNLFRTPLVYFPTDIGYKALTYRHFKSCDRAIRDKKIKFDLIHAHFLVTAGYAGAKLKDRYDTPLVVTAHGYDIYDLPFRDDAWREKITYVLNAADHIITVSNKNRECINKLSTGRPVTVIPNGYDERLFYPMDRSACRELLGLPHDKKILLTIGNLMTEKGQKYLVDAICRIHKARPNIICVIIGSGALMGDLKKQVDRYGLGASVKLVGGKPHAEIPLWINSCDLFVSSSIAEGNPTVLFECMGCGVPFIGTRVGGVPDVITSGRYGLLADPSDAGGLAEKLLEGLDREWDRDAIRQYSQRFTWDNVTKEILGVYKKVLG
jgi:glycosyltransferase involved in cell wall biosynthesis